MGDAPIVVTNEAAIEAACRRAMAPELRKLRDEIAALNNRKPARISERVPLAEAAELLGLSVKHTRKLCRDGVILSEKLADVGSSRLFIRLSEIERVRSRKER